ncbi:hypothetical protein Tco_0077747 [Tanacetum coccineum]
MSDLKFVDTHNLVAFLEKPTKIKGFKEIVDFLNANPIKYALTVNPTIYCSCVKQFWDTVKTKTVNGEIQLQALVDKKKVIITESTIRSDLQLEDANGVDCLPNATIFEQLTPIGKSKKKNTEVPQPSGSTDNVPNENIPTTSNDLLLSGEHRLKLIELMDLCTNLQKKVLDLEKANTTQDSEIASLKKKVKKLERRNKSRTTGLKRLRKGRKIADIDADAEVTLIDETQGRKDDNLIFDTGVSDEQEVEVKKVVSTAKVTTKSATTTTVDELTLAQTLIEIKAAKPKVMQAYDATDNKLPQAPSAPPTILSPSPVLSLSPMFDSRNLFPPEKISPPKDAETPVESPIPVSPYSSVGSSSPDKSTIPPPDYPFDKSIFIELDNSLWIIPQPL